MRMHRWTRFLTRDGIRADVANIGAEVYSFINFSSSTREIAFVKNKTVCKLIFPRDKNQADGVYL